jgi:hypothetical protein
MSEDSKTCLVDGCGNKVKARGYCSNHYKKFIELPKKKAESTALSQAAKQELASKRMSERASKLTMAQLERIFLTPCRIEQDLKNYIKYFFNLHLPDHKVSRYADTTPFHAIWEVYDICVNNNNSENIQELLYVAGRGSGKCVQRGTKILTKSGLKNIENVKIGDNVFTGWSWKSVVETFDEGEKDGVTITTKHLKKHGAWSLTGSLKHRVQALNPESGKIDWVHMKDLTVGQLVYRSVESLANAVDTTSRDYELGWLVGSITGDVSVSRHDNMITLAVNDDNQLNHYVSLIDKHFDIKPKVKKDSRSTKLSIAYICNTNFRSFFKDYIEGELCYFKKLKTLDHSVNFLAGFISGMMETDGSKDSLTLANPALIEQIAQILNLFGVHAVVNRRRRKPSTTKFVKNHVVEYYAVDYKTSLPECLMPLFSKRQAFIAYAEKMNQQSRYPSKLLKPFADYIKNKYEISNGYWRLESAKKTHSNIKHSKDLWGSGEKSKESYVYGYKIDCFIKLANRLEEYDWAEYLTFIRRGCYETVDTVAFGKHYFYDLEVDTDHAYWSNGFISHNTLGMAIAELLVLLHDQRDVVHVGAILSQAKRCYEYQQKFLMSDRIKPLVLPTKTEDSQRILEKFTMEKSVFNVASEKVTLEIIPCTLKACVISSSEALDVNGAHKPLADFKPGDLIKSTENFVEVLENTLEDAECMRIELEDGRTIEGTLDHKVWTQRGWVELQHLTDDDDVLSA